MNLRLVAVLLDFEVGQLGPEGRRPRSEGVWYSSLDVASRAVPRASCTYIA